MFRALSFKNRNLSLTFGMDAVLSSLLVIFDMVTNPVKCAWPECLAFTNISCNIFTCFEFYGGRILNLLSAF